MIPAPKDLLVTLYNDWKHDLDTNLAEQARLQEDEARLREIVATCEQAFVMLFPEPPAPEEPLVEE